MTFLSTSFPSCTETSRTSQAADLQPPWKQKTLPWSFNFTSAVSPSSPCALFKSALVWTSSTAEGSKVYLVRDFCPGRSLLDHRQSGWSLSFSFFCQVLFFFFYRNETERWKGLLRSWEMDLFCLFFFKSRGSHRESRCGVESEDSHRWDGEVHLRTAVTN